MKRFKNKKMLTIGLVTALVLGLGGAAFAYFTTTGTGTGSAHVGTPSNLVITQLGTPAYNSTVPLADYTYSQAFNGTQINRFGNEVTLASSSGPLTSAVVAMVNFGSTAFTTHITFSVYSPSLTLLTSDTENVAVPNCAVPGTVCSASGHAKFNATFSNFSPSVVLPSTVVYGIKLVDLVTNDLTPVGSLNVALSTEPINVSVGSDTNPGYLFVDENPAVSLTPAGQEITCSALVSGFAQYPTAADPTTGCGETTQSVAPFANDNFIPAVELNVSGMGDLYPGGPAQPINFSVTNPGSIPDALATVTIAVAADPVSNLVEAVPGYTSSDIAGCYANWFTIIQPSVINGSVAAGQTWVDSPSGASITMPSDSVDNQDGCEGANIGLTFTAA